MGEDHPAARKVVLEFTTTDLATSIKLTTAQCEKLAKLLGPRYDPLTDTARMSAEKFEHAAQNKRYLGDVLSSLIREARNADDMFADVPLDTRHVEKRSRVRKEARKEARRFPREWLVDAQRVPQLQELREAQAAFARDPQGSKEAATRDEVGQGRIAEYMGKMALGRRDAPGRAGSRAAPTPATAAAEQGARERVEETVTVR